MLKQRIARGDILIGSFAFLGSPDVVEILALAGMDYVIIDTEHSPKDWGMIQHMIRAANLHDLPVLIRVAENAEKLILQCLEIGADGIVLPFVQDAADAERAARASFYPPMGERGTCTVTRMTGYGARRATFLDHCRAENDRLVLVAQVEDRKGIDNIDAIIAAPPGIDAVLVGRSDLAASFGHPGNVEAGEVLAATDRVIDAVASAARPVAIAMGIYTHDEVVRWKAKGCTVFFAPSDGLLMYNAARSWLHSLKGSE